MSRQLQERGGGRVGGSFALKKAEATASPLLRFQRSVPRPCSLSDELCVEADRLYRDQRPDRGNMARHGGWARGQVVCTSSKGRTLSVESFGLCSRPATPRPLGSLEKYVYWRRGTATGSGKL
jgi:hypothetical protein